MTPPARLLGILPALLLGACSTFTGGPSPLRKKSPLPAEFQGWIGTRPAPAAAPVPRGAPIPASALKMDGDAVETRALLLSADAEAIRSLLGLTRLQPVSLLVDRKEAAQALRLLQEKGKARGLSSPRLVSWARQKASVSLKDQVSYVAGFKMESGPKGMVLDPQVNHLQKDSELTVIAGPGKAPDQVDLQVQVHLARPQGPLPAVNIQSPAFPGGVTLQVPLLFFQDLSTRASLAPGRAILLAGLAGDRDDRTFAALVWAHKLDVPK